MPLKPENRILGSPEECGHCPLGTNAFSCSLDFPLDEVYQRCQFSFPKNPEEGIGLVRILATLIHETHIQNVSVCPHALQLRQEAKKILEEMQLSAIE